MPEPLLQGVAEFARNEVLSEARRRRDSAGPALEFMTVQRLLQMRSAAAWQVVAGLVESGQLVISGVQLVLPPEPQLVDERGAGRAPAWPGTTPR